MSLANQFIKNCTGGPIANGCVMEDAREQKKETSQGVSYQETRCGQRPARMVGLLNLDRALFGKDADCAKRRLTTWQRSKG